MQARRVRGPENARIEIARALRERPEGFHSLVVGVSLAGKWHIRALPVECRVVLIECRAAKRRCCHGADA